MRVRPAPLALLAVLGLGACGQDGPDASGRGGPEPTLVLYSSLPEHATRALCAAYTAATGVRVEYMVDTPDRLIEAMAANEHHPAADLLIVEGTRPLALAVDADVLRPAPRGGAFEEMPAGLRDVERYWLGLAADMLAIVYRPGLPESPASYASLANESLKGRLCLRGAEAESMRSLVAALIAALGPRAAELVVRGWKLNLAGPPAADDANLLRSVDDGTCDAAIVGISATALYLDANPASGLAPAWPLDGAVGTQRQLVGAGIGRHAGNALTAADALDWLAGRDGQRALVAATGFLPLLPVAVNPLMFEAPGASDPGPAMPAGNVLHAAEILPLLDRARFANGVVPLE